MALQQLLIIAVASVAVLAVSRVVRVRLGRGPHPEGIWRPLFPVAFLVVPPIALGLLIDPTAGVLGGIAWLPLYTVMLAALAGLMWVAAQLVRLVAPGRSRRLLVLALVASEGDLDDVAIDPPVTAKLAESVALVDSTNALFPRGLEFPAQIDRAEFRDDWNALDTATRTLEGRIADDHKLGLPVASAAMATAQDARSRLDTLRHLAVDHGQTWATT